MASENGCMTDADPSPQAQPRNPLHGLTLEAIVTALQQEPATGRGAVVDRAVALLPRSQIQRPAFRERQVAGQPRRRDPGRADPACHAAPRMLHCGKFGTEHPLRLPSVG